MALVERGRFGGTCLNVGCIPTKMLVHTADVAATSTTADRLGLTETLGAVRWPDVRDRIFGRSDPLAADADADVHGTRRGLDGARRRDGGAEDREAQLVQLGDMAQRTATRLGQGLTKESVSASLSVSAQGESNIVDVSATAVSPGLAADIMARGIVVTGIEK